jgi:hypothetical protein
MLYKETVHIYTEKHTEPINKKNQIWLLKQLVHIAPLGFLVSSVMLR